MNITANNITQTLIALIALAGEIPKDINISEVSKKTLMNQISKNKKDQILKVDKSHNRIRIRSPKGLEYLEAYSPDLYAHYMMVSNGHNFKTGDRIVTNQKLFSSAVLMMIRNGYQIDNIEITHTPNHFGLNEDKEASDMLIEGILNLGSNTFVKNMTIEPIISTTSLVPKDEKRFYTSKYLKYGHPITERINTSRISGLLLSAENMYSLYYLDEIKIYSAAEKEMTDLSRAIYKNAYGKPCDQTHAIFVSDQIPIRTDAITKTFSSYHIIPNDLPGDFVMRILETENWEERLCLALYGESGKKPYDGIYQDTPSWELVSCNYEKIKTARKIAGSERVNFICMEWQLPLIKPLVKKLNCTVQTLTNEQNEIMLNYIKGEEK